MEDLDSEAETNTVFMKYDDGSIDICDNYIWLCFLLSNFLAIRTKVVFPIAYFFSNHRTTV